MRVNLNELAAIILYFMAWIAVAMSGSFMGAAAYNFSMGNPDLAIYQMLWANMFSMFYYHNRSFVAIKDGGGNANG